MLTNEGQKVAGFRGSGYGNTFLQEGKRIKLLKT
jgi:hypothetical protein